MPRASSVKKNLIVDEPISSDSEEESEDSSGNELEETTLSHTKVTDKSVESDEKKKESRMIAHSMLSKIKANISDITKMNIPGPRRRVGLQLNANVVQSNMLENHMKSKNIRNPWNCFLLEAKLLRDYFVDEVVPQQGSQQTDPNFFNHLRF